MKQFFLSVMLVCCAGSLFAQGENPFDRILSGTETSPGTVACAYPEFAFLTPEMAGNLKMGIISGNQSVWLNNPKNIKTSKTGSGIAYEVSDPLLGKGKLIIRAVVIPGTDGIVIETEAIGVPAALKLFWSFGGAYGKIITDTPGLSPLYCKDNVFSVEGNAFTLYYGESMALKTFQGVVPDGSEIRLSDARRQSEPLAFFQSGKKTDAPALAATVSLQAGKKYYFCFYQRGDYNYFMLPDLFQKANSI